MAVIAETTRAVVVVGAHPAVRCLDALATGARAAGALGADQADGPDGQVVVAAFAAGADVAGALRVATASRARDPELVALPRRRLARAAHALGVGDAVVAGGKAGGEADAADAAESARTLGTLDAGSAGAETHGETDAARAAVAGFALHGELTGRARCEVRRQAGAGRTEAADTLLVKAAC